MTTLAGSWQSAKVVRTREKVSFFVGVMTLLFSALMFGVAPQCVTFSPHFISNVETAVIVSQVGTRCVYAARLLPFAFARLYIQETGLALLPL